MSDLQILVAKGSENWRTAHSRGLCPFQVLDKFSISVKVERRLTFTQDPQWPSMLMSGNLPSLSIHINEKKIQALNKCLKLMSGSNNQSGVSPAGYSPPSDTEYPGPQGRAHYTSQSDFEATIQQKSQALLEESKLLEMQFSVDKMSLAIHSRGRCISEFQISRVRTDLVKRPFDSSISLSVHSLLVIDALQQFGPDFELLLASHKDLSMHAPSGSIVDSEASTPRSLRSPTSPRSPASPAEKMMEPTSHAELASAIRQMGANSKGGNQSGASSLAPPALSPFDPVVNDKEALIHVELQLINADRPSNTNNEGPVQVAVIQVNSLDVIANQETIVELLSFFQQAFPEDENKPKQSPEDPSSFTNSLLREASIIEPSNSQTPTRTEISADFRCLNIVMVRGIMGTKVRGQKVATATVSEAHVHATLGGEMSVGGFLGGLQLLDLTPEGSRHQKVFSVGQDPTTTGQKTSLERDSVMKQSDQTDLYKSALDTSRFSTIKDTEDKEVKEDKKGKEVLRAFSFTFKKGRDVENATAMSLGSPIKIQVGGEDIDEQLNLSLHLASLCYIHVPRFLHEVTLCMDEFQSSIANLANSIQKAAGDAARELIQSQMPDLVTSFSPSMFNTMMESPGKRGNTFGDSSMDMTDSRIGAKSHTSMNFDIVMETPVIIIPRTASSSELLVAHLGKISLTNSESSDISRDMDIESTLGLDPNPDMTRFFLRIQNVNLFSFNHEDTNVPSEQSVTSISSDIMSAASGPYSGTPILHNTSLEVIVNQIPSESGPPVMDNSMAFPDLEEKEPLDLDHHSSTLQVVGKVVTHLKVILSKHIYEQILQTLDNLTYDEPTKVPSTPVSLEKTKGRKSGIFNVKELEPLGTQSKTPGYHRVTESTPIRPAGSKLPMRICANFAMPDLCIQMRGDLSDGDQGIVNVCFSDFSIDYEKSTPAATSVTILLQSLVIEDLLQSPDSKHRQLVASHGGTRRSGSGPSSKMVHSTSCPSVTAMPAMSPIRPSSVPSELNNPDQYYAPQYSRQTSSSSRGMYPSTPPPSLNISLEDINISTDTVPTSDALVQIRVLLVDKKSPEYATKYKKTNQFVDVEFNQLDITINQQTWVVLLDFLGIGSSLPKDNVKQDTPTRTSAPQRQTSDVQPLPTQQTSVGEPEGNNMEMQVHLASLSLILNKPDYELAKASVSEVNAHMTNMEGNLEVKGHMGSMSVLDLTPHGRLYRERFTTKGEEALSFHIFKHHVCRSIIYHAPLSMEYCPSGRLLARLEMDCLPYLVGLLQAALQSFQPTILQPSLCQDFLELVEMLRKGHGLLTGTEVNKCKDDLLRGVMNEALERWKQVLEQRMAQRVSVEPTRTSRIMLDVQAGSPVILAPVSSQSKDLLVINLGNLTLRNQFLMSGTPGTIIHKTSPPKPHPEDPKPSEESSKPARETPRKVATAHGLNLEDSPGLGLGTAPGVLTRASTRTAVISKSSHGPQYSSTPKHSPRVADEASEAEVEVSKKEENLSCLLDCIQIDLEDMDLYPAERVSPTDFDVSDGTALIFPSFIVQRKGGKLLKQTCLLKLQVDRNLDIDIRRTVPDMEIDGLLSSVHCCLDLSQYQLIRGFLDHNLGEPLEEFQTLPRPSNPESQTVLSGQTCTNISMHINLVNVTLELLLQHASDPVVGVHGNESEEAVPERSLGQFNFMESKFSFMSQSNGAKTVDLVSHAIRAYDTRWKGDTSKKRSNVFEEILTPTRHHSRNPNPLQLELHFTSQADSTRATALLNNMRVICVFDLLLAVKDFLLAYDSQAVQGSEGASARASSEASTSLDPSTESSNVTTVDKRAFAISVQDYTGIPQMKLLHDCDTSKKRSNVFEEILTPTRHHSRNPNPLQLELHFTSQADSTRATALLNNMRVICVFDLLLAVKDFLLAYDSQAVQGSEGASARASSEASTSLDPSTESSNVTTVDKRSRSPVSIGTGILTKRVPHREQVEKNSDFKVNVTETEFVILGDTSSSDSNAVILKVHIQALNIRVSYHDAQLFLSIMNSLPSQMIKKQHSEDEEEEVEAVDNMRNEAEEKTQSKSKIKRQIYLCRADLQASLEGEPFLIQKLWSTCAVLTYKPVSKENPFSCGLEGLEVFSCCMSSEEDTALSIVDPSTINVELKGTSSHLHSGQQLGGLLDIMDAHAILEVHIQALNIRVSYHDAQLFLSIMNSLPSQMIKKQHSEDEEEEVEAVDNMRNEAEEKTQSKSKIKRQIAKLKELGFHTQDCRKALERSNYRLDLAAGWLLENAQPVPASSPAHSPREPDREDGGSGKMEIAGIEVRAGSLAITLIDDCGNIDIPLIEISCQNLNFFQKLLPSAQGQAACVLSADYYHRSLSGWEPCLEPWKCNVEWIQQAASQMYGERLFIQMKVNDRLDLNVTSALIDLYSNTKKSWTEDYYSKGGRASGSGRTRSPFVPFAIKNQSGCRLSFATLTTTPNKVVSSPEEKMNTERTFSAWKEVESGQEVPFMFEEKGKARHRNTHELRVHQLVVKVDGWEQLTPVSVDKVGVFFRLAKPHHNQLSSIFTDQQPARVVFHVSLEGGARKLITVRSALMVVSRLSVPIELKLVNPQSPTDNPQVLEPLEPNQKVAIPLPCVSWDIYLRPKGWAVSYCDKPLLWRQAQCPGDSKSFPMECRTDSGDSGIFRFCLFVKHEAFPFKGALGRRSQAKKTETLAAQPGHTLTILPPMVLTNLLPMELNFLVVKSNVQGCIRPGMDEPIYTADLDHSQDIKFFTESFRECTQPLTIPAKHNCDGCAYIELRDTHPKRRSLQLAVRVECVAGRALKVGGCWLWVVSSPEEKMNTERTFSAWKEVESGQEIPFMFEEKGKARHRNTHELRVHQLVVKVDGWEQLTPVSVDKVGVFFRLAKPHHNQLSSIFTDQQPARVVFHVSLEGGARKLITVRSALMVVSRLSVPIELKLVNPQSPTDNPQVLEPLEPNQKVAIPLPCVSWDIYLRPKGWAVSYCDKPLLWRQAQCPGDSKSFPMECRTDSGDSGIFRFCLFVKHEAFPFKGSLGRRSQAKKTETLAAQPGHTLTILPPMVLTNLLPMELNFLVVKSKVQGCIRPGMDEPIYTADLDHSQDIKFFTESFRECTHPLTIPAKHNCDGCAYIELRDTHPKRRSLQLAVRVECVAGRALKVSVSAPYWLINKSGLPLVFREEGADFDAAGQYDEHERARSVAPLMLSYREPGKADNMCVMRLGQSIIGLEGRPNWCHRMSLEGGTGVRSLRIHQDGGRPHISNALFVQCNNLGPHHIKVGIDPKSQKNDSTIRHNKQSNSRPVSAFGPKNPRNHLAITSGSKVIFHWPRDDLDRLLCVRMHDLEGCRWSGGIRIDQPGSLNINMRSNNNQTNIVHVEVRLRGATFYVIFTDTTDLPPPYRIDNMSEVDIIYYQRGVTDPTLRTMLRPKMSVPYAWDEPILPPLMVCEVKGGSSSVYNLDKLEDGNHLYYENFIYIAMDSTFKGASSLQSFGESSSNKNFWSSAQLVLDVPHADSPVVLRKKEPGKRSQLWRMTSTGLLQNEAFAAPRDPGQRRSSLTKNGLVLDISNGQFTSRDEMILKLRRPDEARQNTQTWYFGKDGRLRCQDSNYVVQPKFGLLSLKEGSELILIAGGRLDVSQDEIPLEQVITRQKNLPGSGNLAVQVVADGPTRVLYISDNIQQIRIRQLQCQGHYCWAKARSLHINDNTQQIALWLKERFLPVLGNRAPEGIDNQLDQDQKPVMLFASDKEGRPALSLVATKQLGGSPTVEIYKRLVLTVSKMTLNVEELLLLKLLQMSGFSQPDITTETTDETHYDTISPRDNNQPTKRFFFETLKIHAKDFRLSMYTSTKIPKDLNQLKTSMRLFLIQFEEAPVSLDPFTRQHPFETQEFLLESVAKHYTEELKSQAVKILGSVDFLGNPIGLLQDFKDGLKELVLEGSVTGLVKNVTHGMSNTAAKVTGTISDGIGTATFDNRHQEMRSVIRETHGGTSSGHLSAGVKGFAFGVVGGLTSMFTQTYKGASEDGVEGLMKGIGRGIMGTVTKPAAGLFDLASGTMNAIRSSTTSESHLMPPRVRPPRCCRSPSGVLARYSLHDSRGMEFVSVLCDGTSGERYFMMDELRNHPSDGMQVLITSECTYFLSVINLQEPVLSVFHSELFHAKHILQAGKHYIELTKVANTEAGVSAPSLDLKERPKVGCDNERIAKKVSQQINYAKSCYEELKQQVIIKSDDAFLKLHLPSHNDD
eukprot:XP_011669186.1 PREDICTED: vacuolar protein sorting-associated protein 13D [Strongylocentrotus purpuratus]